MNKKEKEELCDLMAHWEWGNVSSTSEAVMRNNCREDITKLFGLTDKDLAFARAFKIFGLIMGEGEDDDELFDVLYDMIKSDYPVVVDMIEDEGYEALRNHLETQKTP